MISVDEALKTVIENSLEQKKERLTLNESFGHILAEDIIANDNIPPFDNSAMDGYAIKAEDSTQGKTLKVIEELPAGVVAEKEIKNGEASTIMTGAPVPNGADSVIEVESTEKKKGQIFLNRIVKKGENIRLAGEDIKKGSVVIKKGQLVRPVNMGIAASLGYVSLPVYKKPSVGILSTGSEIIEPEKELTPGKIRDSNSRTLFGLCKEVGIEANMVGIAKDDREETARSLSKALENDVLITTGGVSVGEYDFVKEILEFLRAKRVFWKIAQKPGKPLAFYIKGGKAIFCLPGNPVAVMVCFEVYVRPFLLRSMGFDDIFRPILYVKAAHDIKKKKGRANWFRVNIKEEGGVCYAHLTGPQGSGVLRSMMADGLLYINADSEGVKQGDEVEVMMLNG